MDHSLVVDRNKSAKFRELKNVQSAKEKLDAIQAKYTKDYFAEKEKENWKKTTTQINKDLYFQPKPIKSQNKGGVPKVNEERVTEF